MPMLTPSPRVLACGAWLKNRACLLGPEGPQWSALHGDLSTPEACRALEASARALLDAAGGPVQAIAHDLHPDFFSTRLALRLAAELGVPAIGVQHHHAHIAAVVAEHGLREPVLGLALDGVGLGSDGTAWGGELLWLAPGRWQRLSHLSPLALPGGDAAAREPWRMAAAALHALGRGGEIGPRFAPLVGQARAQGLQTLLARGLNCPPSSSTGRWFDAAAAALGLGPRQQAEAEAAQALQQAAEAWLASPQGQAPQSSEGLGALTALPTSLPSLDLRPLLAELLDTPPDQAGRAAARFHLGLAQGLADWAALAARHTGTRSVCLSGGCFFNALLTRRLLALLAAQGLQVWRPMAHSCGDAGLALGQAWVAAQPPAPAEAPTLTPMPVPEPTPESLPCA